MNLSTMGIQSITETTVNRVIHKFPIPGTFKSTKSINVLSIARIAEQDYVWVEVDPDQPASTDYEVTLVGTGWDFQKKVYTDVYIGTIIANPLVWHYYLRTLK